MSKPARVPPMSAEAARTAKYAHRKPPTGAPTTMRRKRKTTHRQDTVPVARQRDQRARESATAKVLDRIFRRRV